MKAQSWCLGMDRKWKESKNPSQDPAFGRKKKCFIASLCSLIKMDRENQKELHSLKRFSVHLAHSIICGTEIWDI